MDKKLNKTDIRILQAMRSKPLKWWHSFEILEEMGEEQGIHINPNLRSLERAGFLESRKETQEEQRSRIARDGQDFRGGRIRYFYKVTGKGRNCDLEPSGGSILDLFDHLVPEPEPA